VGEIADLLSEIVKSIDLAHLVLDARDTVFSGASRLGFVVGVQLFKLAGEVSSVRITQVVGKDAAQDEPFAELEAEHRILELTGSNALGILIGRHSIRVLDVVPEATAGENAAQIELARQFTAGFVEHVANPLSAVIGMDIDIGAVESVGFGVMIGEK